MSNECVVGVFDSLSPAKAAVHVLDRAGFASEHISIATKHIDPSSEIGKELSLGDDSLRDAAIGASLGGIIGIVSDATIFLVTGVGAIVAAGPLVAAMGAAVGAFLGAMGGWGVHESHIRKYERLVREGNVLVVVSGEPEEAAEADRMLRETDVVEVHLYAESSADAPEIDDRPKLTE